MTHISRPFQIALLAMGLFAAVWFVALRGQSGSAGGSGSTSASSSPAQVGKAAAPGAPAPGSAAAPTPIYHGAAPGVAGLTRAIAKAHEAVATSQQNAKQVEQSSAQASGDSAAGTSTAGSTTGNAHPPTASSNTTAGAGTHPANKHVAAPAGAVSGAASHGANAPTTRSTKASPPPMQLAVERELKQGKVATILFWNPKSTVDESVHRELQVAASAFGGKIAIHNARAAQVGSFGNITRAVQVFQTPTILIVNPRGQTTTLTGLEDAFSIQQAIAEARRT